MSRSRGHNEELVDLRIDPDDAENWRRDLKGMGFSPEEVNLIMNKSDKYYKRQDRRANEFDDFFAFFQGNKGIILSKEERDNLLKFLPPDDND